MGKKKKKIWKDHIENHDFDAAMDYLDLHFNKERVEEIILELKNSKTIHKKVKDILRASRLPSLDKNNIHVKNNIKKIKKGKLLSPILLVRNENRLIIADGYHRTSSIFSISEDLEIPCRIV